MKTARSALARIAALITALVVLLPLAASCAPKKEGGKIKVIGTVFPPYDFAREIGGDFVECEMLLRPGADSHSYTGDDPSDIYRILNCDLFIYIGGESDGEWVEKIKRLCESSGDAPRFLSLAECCGLLEESDEGMIETEDGDADGTFDEHVWTSPANAAASCEAICGALCEIDPANSESYRNNLDVYRAKLLDLDSEFLELAKAASCKTVVFADRFPFRYLADEMGLEYSAAFNGCSSQSEPSPTTVAKLCSIVTEKKLRYIFYIETSKSTVPDLIARNTGCTTLLLHSCHTVTKGQLDEGVSYLSLMEQNLENLRKALLYD